MQRRAFLQMVLGLSALGLTGCGGSEDVSFMVSDTNGGTGNALDVTGRIEPELLVTDGVIGSAFGPATVSALSFRTRISADGVGLLALEDSGGNVRGFALTFPGEMPVVSFESTIIAAVSMEPGFLQLQVDRARDQAAAVRSTPGFAALLAYLRENAGTALDFLSGEVEFQQHLDSILEALGNPLLDGQAEPSGSAVGRTVTLSNPSPRFLSVSRDGQLLPDLLPPFGTLVDVVPEGQSPDYQLVGVGTLENGDPEDSLVDRTFPAIVQTNLLLPLYELAAGQRIALDDALDYFETLNLTYPSLGPAAHDKDLLAAALYESFLANLESVEDDLADNPARLASQTSQASLISNASYPKGLAFVVAAILKFKQHKDNPPQNPIGKPFAMVLIAAALLFLPAILDVVGDIDDGDETAPPTVP